MTRTGKIARLPTSLREELNQRLADGEQGKTLVKWLNALPEVQNVLSAEFPGKLISEQNLSEWKKGGYRDWQARQERCQFIRELQEESGELGQLLAGGEVNRQISVLLSAEMARAVRQVIDQTPDPQDRVRCLARLAETFAQLRREESNSVRTDVIREKWNRELAQAEEYKNACGKFMPMRALLMQQHYLEMFSRNDRSTAGRIASICEPIKPNPSESNQIKPDGS